MVVPNYDPKKAHDYYEAHKHLKGRRPSGGAAQVVRTASGHRVQGGTHPQATRVLSAKERQASARARTIRLTQKLQSLQDALKEATDELRVKRAALQRSRSSAKKTAKKNSDGKTTAKERAQSKSYREKHRAELKAKAKKAASKSGGSSSGSSKKKVADMTINELTDRVSKIRTAISSAKKQLRAANSLSHSQSVNSNYLAHDGAMAVTTSMEGERQNGRA